MAKSLVCWCLEPFPPPGKPQNQRLSWLVTKTTAGLSGESAREKLMAADLWVGRLTSHLAET